MLTTGRRLARAVVAAAVAAVTVPWGGPAAAAVEAPGLVVTVRESCGWLLAGRTTSLRLSVRNDTAARLESVSLVPRLPAGFTATVTRTPAPLLAGRSTLFHVAVTTPAGAVAGRPATLAFDAAGGAASGTVVLTPYVVAPPAPPTEVVVTPGDRTAAVTWQPGPAHSYPGADGAARPRRYRVTASPGGARTTVTDRAAATVAGLTNGTAYTFTVTELNDHGQTASAPSAPVVPVSVPDVVTGVVATGTGSTRHVSWHVPHDNGAAITGYTVTAHPGGPVVTAPAGATAAEVTGLADGTDYAFTVRATNAVGDGPDSLRPGGPPAAHLGESLVATWGEAVALELRFDPDAPPPVDGWLVTVQPGGAEQYVPRDDPGMHPGQQYAAFDRLEFDTTVSVTVRGVNAAGAGPPVPAGTVVTMGEAEPPVVTGVVPAADAVEVCFLGSWHRGSPMVRYLVAVADLAAREVALDERVVTFPVTPPYYVHGARAAWIDGDGFERSPTEESLWIAPSAPRPLPYAYAVQERRALRVEWGLNWPDDQRGDVEVVVSPGGARFYAAGDDGHLWVDGLSADVRYTFTLRLLNQHGYSPPLVTEPASPYDVPGPVPDVTVAPAPDDPAKVVVSWRPANARGSDIDWYHLYRDGVEIGYVHGIQTSGRVDAPPAGATATYSVAAHNAVGHGGPGYAPPYTTPLPDTTAPVVTVTAPPAVTLSRTVGVAYTAPDAASYDVRYRVARYDGDFGAYRHPAAWQQTTTTAPSVVARPGWTYCFGVRARDAAGNVSAWTDDACTTAPVDDAALSASPGWTRGTSSRYYAGTYSATATAGATLTLPLATGARWLALVATRCSTCGDVGVYVGGTLVKRVRLTGPVRSYRQVVTVDLGDLHLGRVTLKSLSGRAYVDGLAALPV